MKRLLFVVALIAILTPIALVRFDSYAAFSEPMFVEIPRGTPTLRIGDKLAEAGVIRHPLLFAAARLMRPGARPQAGEYRFAEAATPAQVFARLARGDVYLVEVTIPEGSNIFDIARILEQAGLNMAEDFIPVARPQEGYLFPSTYRLKRTVTPETVCSAMRLQFDKVWNSLRPSAPQRETVILASLVEREAVLDEERAKIAGVYTNRLRIGMKLDCDPTVEYAAILAGRWRGTIYKSDLTAKHPYNTYVNPGLPPGPIANPGEASLRAALKPAETKAIYFVAAPDGRGGHVFSETIEAHERAVSAYRRGPR